jgi:hypothetical protein
LGLLYGIGIDEKGNPVFALERRLTRLEALAIIIRLLGLEKTALAYVGSNPFDDVPAWGNRYVAYAYNAKITAGVGATDFEPGRGVTRREFTAFLLRGLGYSEKNGDFKYENALQKSVVIGLYDSKGIEDAAAYLRGDAALAMTEALFTKIKGSQKTLLDSLVESKTVTRAAALEFINSVAN